MYCIYKRALSGIIPGDKEWICYVYTPVLASPCDEGVHAAAATAMPYAMPGMMKNTTKV